MRKAAGLFFVLLLVGHTVLVAASRVLPTPESVLGFKPGADNKLATYDQAITYLKRLAAASPSIRLVEAGKTSQGRVMYFALISNPKNLDALDRYREIARKLARPAGMTEAVARQLARDGRAFVHLDGGCHASEVAGAQMTIQLAYDLVNGADTPAIKQILDNDIVMLWPTMNPDGQQMVGEWLAKNAGTPYEGSGLPGLYQEYVGHDNNRDAYMLDMIESRVMEHFWRQWEPNIVYVFHQSSPFPTRIWLPPFSEPISVDAPYVTSREVNMIGMAIAKGLDERGQVGATHMGIAFDAWYPGYVDYVPVFKNVPAFWTETAGSGAAPREYTVNDLPQEYRDLRPQSLYASPWPGGWWRLGDAVAYNETAALATLEYAAKYRESLLYNRYQAGRDQIALGRKTPPFAYVIPQDQRDPVAAVEMLRRIAFGGVRVSQLTAPLTIDKKTYAAGSWVVLTDQEFGAMARELLNVQKYPDLRQYPGGPPVRPYDAAGWTLPLQMGVNVDSIVTPLTDEQRKAIKPLGTLAPPSARATAYNLTASPDAAPFDSVPGAGFDTDPVAAAIVPRAGAVSGSGTALSLDPAQNNTFKALNRAWKAGATVQYAASAAAGARYIVSGLNEAAQAELAKTLALTAERTAPAGTPVKKPRLGLFQPWSGSMDEGWTRWILERYDFDIVTVHPEDFQKPLRDRIDVLILADDARVPTAPAAGAPAAAGRGGAGAPPAGAAAAGAPAAGRGGQGGGGGRGGGGRAVRPEYAYALTPADLQAFENFVRGGGTVVCFNSGCRWAIQQFKLPVKNVVDGLKPEEFFLRGSIVNVKTDPTHPVMAGMTADAAVFVDGSPVYEPQVGFKGTILAKYAETGSPLLSGYLIGEKFLQGKVAALDVELDKGHVVLLGFRPQWRGQSFGTFRIVFNAALFSR